MGRRVAFPFDPDHHLRQVALLMEEDDGVGHEKRGAVKTYTASSPETGSRALQFGGDLAGVEHEAAVAQPKIDLAERTEQTRGGGGRSAAPAPSCLRPAKGVGCARVDTAPVPPLAAVAAPPC